MWCSLQVAFEFLNLLAHAFIVSARNLPTEITMSISSAPSISAMAVSATFTSMKVWEEAC